jgi:hypothetical protein
LNFQSDRIRLPNIFNLAGRKNSWILYLN